MSDRTPSRPRSPLALRFLRPTLGTLQKLSTNGAAALAERWFFRAPRAQVSASGRQFLASGRRFDARVDGRPVVGWVWGNGSPVYLVHGWGGSASRWESVAGPMIAAGYQVIGFDAPGHGHSGKGMSSLPEFARALEVVSTRFGPAQAIVAHSMGAAATVVALASGVTARRVVLLAPPANPAQWAWAFASALGLQPEVMRRLRVRSENRLRFNWDDLDILVPARTMTAPLLVVHDRGDETVPYADGAAITEAWPGAQLIETDGLGHRGVLRDPAVISQVLEFVSLESGQESVGVPVAPAGELEQLEHELFYRDTRWSSPGIGSEGEFSRLVRTRKGSATT